MKKESFDFINFGHALGRREMKKLMAGSGCSITVECSGGDPCKCTAENGTCERTSTGCKSTDSSGTSECNC